MYIRAQGIIIRRLKIVRFFKRFDEVVVTDMSKHAGKGAMDTKLGT